jgi:hypothetical protein
LFFFLQQRKKKIPALSPSLSFTLYEQLLTRKTKIPQ